MIRTRALSRAVPGLAAAAVLAGLAACGSVRPAGHAGAGLPPSSPPAASQRPVTSGAAAVVCANISRISALQVRRVASIRSSHMHFPIPPVRAVTDPARARQVAAAMCALPRLPGGALACPNDPGISYRLGFSGAGRAYPPAVASAGGCRQLVGLDGTRHAVPAFWVTLGRALGIPRPGNDRFTGLPPAGPVNS